MVTLTQTGNAGIENTVTLHPDLQHLVKFHLVVGSHVTLSLLNEVHATYVNKGHVTLIPGIGNHVTLTSVDKGHVTLIPWIGNPATLTPENKGHVTLT